ncbi:MAG: HzsA-related protein [Pirellulaceae bacterium]
MIVFLTVGSDEPVDAAAAAGGIDVPVLVTLVPSRHAIAASSAAPSSPLTFVGEGGRILAIGPDGTRRVVTEEFHSAADPALSFDAQRFVFAGKRAATDLWNVYEFSFESGQTRQVTRDCGNCRQPSYQSNLFTVDSPEPWFQLTFVSDAGGWMNEDGGGISHSLYSCRMDGSQIRRFTYNLSDDADPLLMGDGRLVYASWQRATLDRGPAGRVALFGINIEGTDNSLFGDLAGKRIKRMPCVTDRGLVLFIECDGPQADGGGQIGSVTFRRPLKSYRAVTSEKDGFVYRAPSCWTQGCVLISRRPLDASASWGAFILDPKTLTCQPILDDPAYDEVQAVAVRATRQPDGRSTVVDDTKPTAKMYGLNVEQHDLPDASWLPPGTATRLRVLEGVPDTVSADNDTVSAGDASRSSAAHSTLGPNGLSCPSRPPIAQRRLLGEAPIQPDGSFHINIPPNTPIQLQTLDENGLALRTCGWIWSKNLEPRGCIGCHEDGESTPENTFVDALRHPAVVLTLPPERRRTVDFRRDVMPILEQKCVACHDQKGDPPRLDGGMAPVAGSSGFNRAYVNLLAARDASDAQTGRGLYVHSGRARTSPLIWHVLGRNTSRPWDGEATNGQAAKPIPPGTVAPLTKLETRILVEWIDMGALWDGIPGADEFESNPPTGSTSQ